MKVTLVDIEQPEVLFCLLDTFEKPVRCQGIDLRQNSGIARMVCGMAAHGKGIPRLELELQCPRDLSSLLRYMREGAAA